MLFDPRSRWILNSDKFCPIAFQRSCPGPHSASSFLRHLSNLVLIIVSFQVPVFYFSLLSSILQTGKMPRARGKVSAEVQPLSQLFSGRDCQLLGTWWRGSREPRGCSWPRWAKVALLWVSASNTQIKPTCGISFFQNDLCPVFGCGQIAPVCRWEGVGGWGRLCCIICVDLLACGFQVLIFTSVKQSILWDL